MRRTLPFRLNGSYPKRHGIGGDNCLGGYSLCSEKNPFSSYLFSSQTIGGDGIHTARGNSHIFGGNVLTGVGQVRTYVSRFSRMITLVTDFCGIRNDFGHSI